MPPDYIVSLDTVTMADVPRVGGKNASLGEMIRHLARAGVNVPGGFATTAEAFWDFIDHNQLRERIHAQLAALDVADIPALAAAGMEIRNWVEVAALPPALESELRAAYRALGDNVSVAVRSSATAEDLPDASFAGQHESYLHVSGEEALLVHVKKVFASLYNDRAIAYRAHHALHARRQSDAIVVKTMVHAIGNRAVVVERSEEFFYMHKQRIFAAHMQIAFMLAGKRGVGQVFRRSR